MAVARRTALAGGEAGRWQCEAVQQPAGGTQVARDEQYHNGGGNATNEHRNCGTRKNEESMSISTSPRFDLSCWTKKTVAGARSSTSRWSLMAMDGRRPGNPRFPVKQGMKLRSMGLGRW